MTTLGIRKNRQVALLRGVGLFSGCTNAELGHIASLTTEYHAKPRQVLAERGEPGSEFFVVVEGEATATRKGVFLQTLGPGSFFGELALLDGGTRTATVVAKTDMRLLVLSRREFRTLQTISPSVSNKMLAELGRRVRRMDDLVDAPPALNIDYAEWSLL